MYKSILLLSSAIFLVLGCNLKTNDNATKAFDELRNEGFVAFIVNEVEAEGNDDRPHPDASKCACKGTGYIWHGDGHQTKCPYHDEPEEDDDDDKDHKCPCDTRKTYCNCVNYYGKCNCKTE